MAADASHWWTDDQLAFFDKLARLALYVGEPADDQARALIAEIQDEFNNIKNGAVREGFRKPGPLNAEDVLEFGTTIGGDFPKAQKGCEVFASIAITEILGNAPNN